MGGDSVVIGDITNSNVNVKAHLDNARQLVKTIPNAAPDAKAQLEDLIRQLNEQLKQAPPENAEDAEAAAEQTKALVEQANKPKPNKRSMEITGKGMLEAVGALAEVVPAALPIAEKIAETAARLFG